MIARECVSDEIDPITVAPVVVKPLIDSNSAFTGWAIVPVPASTKGSAPTRAAASQVHNTNSSASRGPRSGSGSRRSSPAPRETAPSAVAAKASTPSGLPSYSAIASGGTSAAARYLTIVPSRLALARHSTRRSRSKPRSEPSPDPRPPPPLIGAGRPDRGGEILRIEPADRPAGVIGSIGSTGLIGSTGSIGSIRCASLPALSRPLSPVTVS
jgi:hypothetical protein